MTTLGNMSLFDAMDVVADVLRGVVELSYCTGDDQVVFRYLQKQKQPGLTPEQSQNLFAEWQDHYNAECARDRERALANISKISDELASRTPPTKFQCVCGAEGDPLDPAFERIHRPHVFLAQFDKPPR